MPENNGKKKSDNAVYGSGTEIGSENGGGRMPFGLNTGSFLFFIILLILLMMKKFNFAVIFGSYDQFQSQFGLNYTQLGSLTSVFYMCDLIFTFFWVYLFGKGYKPKKLFIFGNLLWITPMVLMITVPGGIGGYYFTLFLLGLIGAGIESTTVYFFYYFIKIIPSNTLGKGYAFYIIVKGAGGVFGVFITSVFQSIFGWDWRYIFSLFGLISGLVLIGGVILYSITGEISKQSGKSNTIESTEIATPDFYNPYELKSGAFREILRNPVNKLIILYAFIVPSIDPLITNWQMKYFREIHGMNQLQAGITFIFNSGGEVIGTILGALIIDHKRFSEKIPRATFWTVSLGTSAILFYLGLNLSWKMEPFPETDFIKMCWNMFIYALSHPDVFMGFTVFFSAFVIFSSVNMMAFVMVSDINPVKYRGTLNATIQFGTTLDEFIVPFISGILADLFGLRAVMVYLLPSIVGLSSLIAFGILVNIKKVYYKGEKRNVGGQ